MRSTPMRMANTTANVGFLFQLTGKRIGRLSHRLTSVFRSLESGSKGSNAELYIVLPLEPSERWWSTKYISLQ
jgi:hypothetical protein